MLQIENVYNYLLSLYTSGQRVCHSLTKPSSSLKTNNILSMEAPKIQRPYFIRSNSHKSFTQLNSQESAECVDFLIYKITNNSIVLILQNSIRKNSNVLALVRPP